MNKQLWSISVTDDPDHPHLIGGKLWNEQRQPIYDEIKRQNEEFLKNLETFVVKYCPNCDFEEFANMANHEPELCWRCKK